MNTLPVADNRLVLQGTMDQSGGLRYTPAGVPALQFQLCHHSQQWEAGLPREVTLTLPAVALGEIALTLAAATLPVALRVEGFLAPRNHRSAQAVLHVQKAVFLNSANGEPA